MMQAGFLFLETGLTRAKNYINVAIKNIVDFGFAFLLYWAIGFAIMFGFTSGGWFGTDNFFVSFASSDHWLTTFFLFQVVFAGTTVTIVSGAVAERIRFEVYLVVAGIVSLIYPFFGHWVWGGAYAGDVGWLAARGFVDFAGSTVVHSVGGWAGLAAVLVTGPRLGRFAADGTSKSITPSNLPMAMFGTLILWFGWIGFNGGSTLAFDETVPGVVANTMLAASAGLAVSFLTGWLKVGYPAPTAPLNGALAGLVAITANAHAVSATSAFLIGGIGAFVMMAVESLLERNRIDDSVGAIPVHLGAGIWGTLAVGIFADLEVLGTGLSRLGQIGVQLMGIGVAAVTVFGITYIAFRIINSFRRFRVDPEDEYRGLNVSEHKATTELIDLLKVMDEQSKTGDVNLKLEAEPFTEVGQIAEQYNLVIAHLQEVSIVANDIASGQLNVDVTLRSERDTFGISFKAMVDNLRGIVTSIFGATENVDSSAQDMSTLSRTMSQASQEQSRSIESILSSMNAITGRIGEFAQNVDHLVSRVDESAKSIDEVSTSVGRTATNGETLSKSVQNTSEMLSNVMGGIVVMSETMASVNQAAIESVEKAKSSQNELQTAITAISTRSEQISEFVQVIEDISDQTNLLALNASIEAARAGESGRSFAVVAGEVRKLAERSAKAAREVGEMVESTRVDTDKAVNLTGDSLSELVSSVEKSTSLVGEVSKTAEEHGLRAKEALEILGNMAELVLQIVEAAKGNALDIEQINQVFETVNELSNAMSDATLELQNESTDVMNNVENISTVSKRNAVSVEEIAQSADNLAKESESLREQMKFFNLDGFGLSSP